MQNQADGPASIFVVVLNEMLVALDIAGMTSERWPSAVIVRSRSLETVSTSLPAGRTQAMFVQANAGSDAISPLMGGLSATAGRQYWSQPFVRAICRQAGQS